MKFTWDLRKEESNFRKHGIAFDAGSSIFADEYHLTLLDQLHSKDEERWISIGMNLDGKVLVVVHTFRLEDDIEIMRIISARKATKAELNEYFDRRPKEI